MTLVMDSERAGSDAARAMNSGGGDATSESAEARDSDWRAGLKGLRVAFAGGGTGGHIAPGRHLLEHVGAELDEVLWFCTGRPVEERAFEGLTRARRVALDLEPPSGGAPSLAWLALRTAPSVLRARRELARARSEVLLGLGGFTTLPAVLAARLLGIPVALLEINAAPGRATRRLAPLAARTFHAWRSTLPSGEPSARDLWTGPPLPPRLIGVERSPASLARARAALGFAPDLPLLVVLGGSQGAGALNEFVASQAPVLLRGAQVLHQTGPGRGAEAASARPGYRAVEFLSDVPAVLAAATAVLCRGGASTLAEVAAARCPAWVVPYPHHADRHQERNARALGQGVVILDQARLDAHCARELLQQLTAASPQALQERSAALARALPLDAAARIWRELGRLRVRS
jgi:UDP-N-acetylglucosamine--N-acetylmuramyl-(pentapeptide) pyrophosphoryl-undecaprenol N-acetylglucosamine transferase